MLPEQHTPENDDTPIVPDSSDEVPEEKPEISVEPPPRRPYTSPEEGPDWLVQEG